MSWTNIKRTQCNQLIQLQRYHRECLVKYKGLINGTIIEPQSIMSRISLWKEVCITYLKTYKQYMSTGVYIATVAKIVNSVNGLPKKYCECISIFTTGSTNWLYNIMRCEVIIFQENYGHACMHCPEEFLINSSLWSLFGYNIMPKWSGQTEILSTVIWLYTGNAAVADIDW